MEKKSEAMVSLATIPGQPCSAGGSQPARAAAPSQRSGVSHPRSITRYKGGGLGNVGAFPPAFLHPRKGSLIILLLRTAFPFMVSTVQLLG